MLFRFVLIFYLISKSNTSATISESSKETSQYLTLTTVIENINDAMVAVPEYHKIIENINKFELDLSNHITNLFDNDIDKVKTKTNELINNFIVYLNNKIYLLEKMNKIRPYIEHLYKKFDSDEVATINFNYTYFTKNIENTTKVYEKTICSLNSLLQEINNTQNIAEFKSMSLAKEGSFFSEKIKNMIENVDKSMSIIKESIERLKHKWSNVVIENDLIEFQSNDPKSMSIIKESIERLKHKWCNVVIENNLIEFQSNDPELWNDLLDAIQILLFYYQNYITLINCMKSLINSCNNNQKIEKKKILLNELAHALSSFEKSHEGLIKLKQNLDTIFQKIKSNPQLSEESKYALSAEMFYETVLDKYTETLKNDSITMKSCIITFGKIKKISATTNSFLKKTNAIIFNIDNYFGNKMVLFSDINTNLSNAITSFKIPTNKILIDDTKKDILIFFNKLNENIQFASTYLSKLVVNLTQQYTETMKCLKIYENDEDVKAEYESFVYTISNANNEINEKIKTYRDIINQQKIYINEYNNDDEINIILMNQEETSSDNYNLKNINDSTIDEIRRSADQFFKFIKKDESIMLNDNAITEQKTSFDDVNNESNGIKQDDDDILIKNIYLNEKKANEDNNAAGDNILNENDKFDESRMNEEIGIAQNDSSIIDNIYDGNKINTKETSLFRSEMVLWAIISVLTITTVALLIFYIFYYKKNI
ncbi:hypothetical protein TCON_0450 [Astathelohania contejeani]|uniref:Uncharacterized protein n=1 Tax=Astathelohania contejeani TaxID=164912 RepID=A0ABQ7I1N3_9MICR|nr:hypothetical protein TCON_0450 [Thelohania contejeani]